MKNFRLFFTVLAFEILFVVMGCSVDEYPVVDGLCPNIQLCSDDVHIEYGMTANIKGKITDADGIRYINIKNSDLNLDETINILEILGDSITEYNLDCKVTPDSNLSNYSFPLKVTVEDLVGNKSTSIFHAVMDGDYSAPKFVYGGNDTINVNLPEMIFKFVIVDNKDIDYCRVSIPELNVDEVFYPNTKSFEFVKKLKFDIDDCMISGKIKACDSHNNTMERNFVISKSKLQNYSNMYLHEINNKNLGEPMLATHSGEYKYHIKYYNKIAGQRVCFVPELSNNDNSCNIYFGADTNEPNILTSNFDNAFGIQLLEANTYYAIDIDTKKCSYNVRKMDASEISDTDFSTSTSFFNELKDDIYNIPDVFGKNKKKKQTDLDSYLLRTKLTPIK